MKKLTLLIAAACLFISKLEAETHILINTLPKSGSVYIGKVLRQFYKLPFLRVSHSSYPEDEIIYEDLMNFLSQDALCQEHFPASSSNVEYLKEHLNKIVIHVRDPRQALISYIHHLDRVYNENDAETLKLADEMPQEYFSWDFEQKVDWQIEHFYKSSITWLEGWLEVEEKNPKLNILFTKFEDMKKDPLLFFRNIVAFYGTNPKTFTKDRIKKPNEGAAHFRKGEIDEWKTVLSDHQKELVCSLLSEKLRNKFEWQ